MTVHIRRGDVVIAATGSGFGGKPRPFVVLQADDYPTATVILAGCSSMLDTPLLARPLLEPTPANGLMQPCRVMIDILVTSPRDKISRVAGRLTDAQRDEVDAALMIVLGLGAS